MKARAIQKHVRWREYGELKTEIVLLSFSGVAILMATGAILIMHGG